MRAALQYFMGCLIQGVDLTQLRCRLAARSRPQGTSARPATVRPALSALLSRGPGLRVCACSQACVSHHKRLLGAHPATCVQKLPGLLAAAAGGHPGWADRAVLRCRRAGGQLRAQHQPDHQDRRSVHRHHRCSATARTASHQAAAPASHHQHWQLRCLSGCWAVRIGTAAC